MKRSSYLMSIRHQSSSYASLPDQNPTAFNIYVQWLYSRQLHTKGAIKQTNGAMTSASDPSPVAKEWRTLIDVYLLGYKLRDIDFQDKVMDGILGWLREATTTEDLLVVLENVTQAFMALCESPQDHPLRRLFSDVVAFKFTHTAIQKMGSSDGISILPGTFMRDVITKLSSRLQDGKMFGGGHVWPEYREGCHYHCHEQGACYKLK